LSPRTTARPPRPPTRLENTVRRILAEPERSEAFRQLADRLRADLTQISGRSLVIAGIGPASDTYEVVLHAAAILAEAGEPILIIDGDMVRRSLTSELELKHGTGLVELALGEIPEADPIQELTLVNLSILPAGIARMPDPASVTDRLTSLVESLEGSYRFVIIDAGRASDRAAATLARMCDASYFVARLGETEASQAHAALNTFRVAGARLLGCIATS
jgi:ATPases involved in chromosome partitioning